jgi:hypothetical protein
MRLVLNLELHNRDDTIDRGPEVEVTIWGGAFELNGRRYVVTGRTLVEAGPDGSESSWVVCRERPPKLRLSQMPSMLCGL